METQIVFDVSKQHSTVLKNPAEELAQNSRRWGRFVDMGFLEDAQYGSGETAQWLRALVTLREDKGSVLSTHIRWLTVTYITQTPGYPVPSPGLCEHPHSPPPTNNEENIKTSIVGSSVLLFLRSFLSL